MKVLNTLERGLDRAITVFGGVAMGLIVIIIFVQVICRYVLGSSLSWAEEVALYLEVWVTFLCAGYALGKGQHICMDLLSSRLPPKAQFVLQKVISLICLAFSIFCTRIAWLYVLSESTQYMAALRLPRWIAYAAMLGGSVVMVFYSIVLLVTPRSTSEPTMEEIVDGEEGD